MAAPDPRPIDAWGLPVIKPEPQPADQELGWTCDDDAVDGWEPKDDQGMPFGRFLCILLMVPMNIGRYYGAKARIQYGINRWRI